MSVANATRRFYEGKRFEEGAIMGVPSYYAVHDIEEFAGVSHADGPKLNRDFKNLKGEIVEPFSPKKFWRLPHLLEVKEAGQTLWRAPGNQIQGL
jgi:hypothetical protein